MAFDPNLRAERDGIADENFCGTGTALGSACSALRGRRCASAGTNTRVHALSSARSTDGFHFSPSRTGRLLGSAQRAERAGVQKSCGSQCV